MLWLLATESINSDSKLYFIVIPVAIVSVDIAIVLQSLLQLMTEYVYIAKLSHV